MTDSDSRITEREEIRRFRRLRRADSSSLRNQIITDYDHLAGYFVRRYRNRGVEYDDLLQVARLALIKAVDRFDPEAGFRFSTYAGRTIDGELKRYFRDKTWAVRVPRSVQERALHVRNAASTFSAEHGRTPTARELSEATDLDLEDVVEALDAHSSYRADSLDRPAGDEDGRRIGETLPGSADAPQEVVTNRLTVAQLLETLPERERTILELRFNDRMSQSQIAEQVGVSQMHVSRLLRSTLEQLRGQVSEG